MNRTVTEGRTLRQHDLEPDNFGNVLVVMDGETLRPVRVERTAQCAICEEVHEEIVDLRRVNAEYTKHEGEPICLGCFPDVIAEDAQEGMLDVLVKVRA